MSTQCGLLTPVGKLVVTATLESIELQNIERTMICSLCNPHSIYFRRVVLCESNIWIQARNDSECCVRASNPMHFDWDKGIFHAVRIPLQALRLGYTRLSESKDSTVTS